MAVVVHCTQLVKRNGVWLLSPRRPNRFARLFAHKINMIMMKLSRFLCVWEKRVDDVDTATATKKKQQRRAETIYIEANVYTGSMCARFTLFALASIHTNRIDKFIIIVEMIPHTHTHSHTQTHKYLRCDFFYYLFLQGNNNVRKLCCLFRVETMWAGFLFLCIFSPPSTSHPLNRSLVCFLPTSFLFDFDLMPQRRSRHDGGRAICEFCTKNKFSDHSCV